MGFSGGKNRTATFAGGADSPRDGSTQIKAIDDREGSKYAKEYNSAANRVNFHGARFGGKDNPRSALWIPFLLRAFAPSWLIKSAACVVRRFGFAA